MFKKLVFLIPLLVSTLVFGPVVIALPTLSSVKQHGVRSYKKTTGNIAFDSSYDASGGGEPITPAKLGFSNKIVSLNLQSTAGYVFQYVPSTNRIKVFRAAGLTPGGTNASTTGGTASGSVAAPVFSGTPATLTGTNAVSAVSPEYEVDYGMVTKPVIALTHNADPVGGLSANALYISEASGNSISNLGLLQSNNNATTDVLGETADGTVGGVSASARFFVLHNGTPDGVQIYVNEAESDRLEFVSPTESDVLIIMPMEAAAGAPPGFAVSVRVYHNADAANGKALYFDDNGAADAQLVFVDTGAAGGVIPAGDISVIGPTYLANAAGGAGQSAAQVLTMDEYTPAGTNDAPAFTGDELAGHTHTFTGNAVAAGALVEVTNAFNLSGLTGVYFEATGQ